MSGYKACRFCGDTTQPMTEVPESVGTCPRCQDVLGEVMRDFKSCWEEREGYVRGVEKERDAVAAVEREECAKIADSAADKEPNEGAVTAAWKVAVRIAKGIRARGKA